MTKPEIKEGQVWEGPGFSPAYRVIWVDYGEDEVVAWGMSWNADLAIAASEGGRTWRSDINLFKKLFRRVT